MAETAEITGVLLVGHGTRSGEGVGQFLALAGRMAERLAPVPVEAAFLELQEPGIEVGVRRLVERGIGRLVTVPLLLFAAGHAKRDIPEQVAGALAGVGRNEIEQVQTGHLGCHAGIVELSLWRMEEALAARRGGASGKCVPRGDPGNEEVEEQVRFTHPTCLVLVGRGSNDEAATAEMYEFARLREEEARPEPRPPVNALRPVHVEVAFLAMARPLLEELLPRIAGQSLRRVVVQPHLLFHGELVESVEKQVAKVAAEHGETKWIVAKPLADPVRIVTQASEMLENVILDRIKDAGIHVVAKRGDD